MVGILWALQPNRLNSKPIPRLTLCVALGKSPSPRVSASRSAQGELDRYKEKRHLLLMYRNYPASCCKVSLLLRGFSCSSPGRLAKGPQETTSSETPSCPLEHLGTQRVSKRQVHRYLLKGGEQVMW